MFLPAGVFSGMDRSVPLPSTKTGALFSRYVSDGDSDADGVSSAIAIRDKDSDRIGVLFFIVEGCARSQLSSSADDAKGGCICTTECVRLRHPHLHQ